MLFKVIFNRIQEIYQSKFLKEDLIILPSTSELDHWKSIFPQINILTYSQWLRFECGENSSHLQRSELWMHLFRLWKSCDGRNHYQTFESVFQLFTELRSVVEDGEVFEEVFKIEFPLIEENIRLALKALFIHPLIQDENAHLDTILSKNERLHYENMHWIGFKSLSNKQIAFLNSSKLTNNHHVYIPQIIDLSCQKNNGWSVWLNFDKTENNKIKVEDKQNENFENDFENIIKSHQNARFIKSQEMISQIQYIKDNKTEKKSSIYFLTVNPLSNQSLYQQYLGSSNWSFHQVGNIWDSSFDQIELLLMDEINAGKNYNQVEKIIRNKKDKKNIQFIKMKLLQVFLEEMTALSFDPGESFTTLDFMVIKQKILWDLPRLYWNSTVKMNETGTGHYFQDIQNTYPPRLDNNDVIRILYIENDYINEQNNGTKFDDQTINYLTTFSPLFGKKLKQAWIEQKMSEWLDLNGTYLFVNEELKTTSSFWSKFKFTDDQTTSFEQLNKLENENKPLNSREEIQIVQKNQVRKFSPTGIKTYQECPRKYYWQYIEGDRISPDVLPFFTQMDQGNILHKLMESLSQQKNENAPKINPDYIYNKVQKELEKYNNKIFNDFDKKSEIVSLSNTMMRCFDDWSEFPFFKDVQNWECFWEMDFYKDELRLKGRGDFFAINVKEKSLYVLDFKKGSYSIPTQKEFKNGDSLQVYAALAGFLNIKNELQINNSEEWTWTIGYYCLSEPKESLLASNKSTEICGHKVIHITEDLNSIMHRFETNWTHYISVIDQELEFKPNPKTTDLCHYCDHRFLCERGFLE